MIYSSVRGKTKWLSAKAMRICFRISMDCKQQQCVKKGCGKTGLLNFMCDILLSDSKSAERMKNGT